MRTRAGSKATRIARQLLKAPVDANLSMTVIDPDERPAAFAF
jgi:hypothetical protein